MNRYLLTFSINLFFFLVASNINAQKIEMNNQTKKYEMVIYKTVERNKDDLYDIISEWLPKYFSYRYGNSTLKYNDKSKGKIIFTARDPDPKVNVYYTMSFEIDQNKYTCYISDFYTGEQVLPDGKLIERVHFESNALFFKKKVFKKMEGYVVKNFQELDKLIEQSSFNNN